MGEKKKKKNTFQTEQKIAEIKTAYLAAKEP